MKTVLFFISVARHVFSEHLEGIYQYARKLNWHIQMIEKCGTKAQVREALAFWKPIGVFVEYGDIAAFQDRRLFRGLPVVYFDNGRSRARNCSFVGFDSASAGRLGAGHLLGLGLRHFAYVGYWDRVVWDREREAAFAKTIRAAGRDCEIIRLDGVRGNFGRRSDILQKRLARLPRPCGVMAANDGVGEAVLNICARLGIGVPDEMAVLGVDNDRDICENTMPALTSVVHPHVVEGCSAARLLHGLIVSGGSSGCGKHMHGAERLVVRQSTRRMAVDDSLVADVLEIISREACAGVNVAGIVQRTGVSRRLLERHFRLATGKSILEEITRVRFEKVYELLANSRCPIDSIAGQTGFSTEVALRKAFRKREGCSMGAWRRRH